MSIATPELSVNNISLRFKGTDGSSIHVLENISVSLEKGGFHTIVGPSGCGKSTLLSVIAGLLKPASGTCQLRGVPISIGDPRIGYMFQSDTLLPWATALENVQLPLTAVGRKDDGYCLELLQKVGIADFAGSYPWQLSGGMRKRVQLARLFAQKPEVLLMDEPFGALDAQTKLLMHELLLNLWEATGLTVLFVTHDLSEAISLSDRILLFSARPGTIKQEYTVPLARPRSIENIVQNEQYNDLFLEIWRSLKEEITLL